MKFIKFSDLRGRRCLSSYVMGLIFAFIVLFGSYYIAQEPKSKEKEIVPVESEVIELFSWKMDDHTFGFSLFKSKSFGSLKSEEEFKNPAKTITLDEVKKILSEMQPGTRIIWRYVGNIPEEIQKEINGICSQRKLIIIQVPYRKMQPPNSDKGKGKK